jgi:hypothetical protein
VATWFSLCISLFNDDVFPLNVPKLAQAAPESRKPGGLSVRSGAGEVAYPSGLGQLLRLSLK